MAPRVGVGVGLLTLKFLVKVFVRLNYSVTLHPINFYLHLYDDIEVLKIPNDLGVQRSKVKVTV